MNENRKSKGARGERIVKFLFKDIFVASLVLMGLGSLGYYVFDWIWAARLVVVGGLLFVAWMLFYVFAARRLAKTIGSLAERNE